MKKYLKIILLIAIILFLGFGFWKIKDRDAKTEIQNEKTVQQVQTTLSINDGSSVKSFDASSFVDKTALEATQADTKVVTSGTGVNAFITSINGRAADPKKHEFWELDANGAETQVGAGSYYIKKGDLIEWKLNTY
jgi:hypothetical protein